MKYVSTRLSRRKVLVRCSDKSIGLSVWPVFVGDVCSRRAVCGLGCSGSRSETVLKRLDPELFPKIY